MNSWWFVWMGVMLLLLVMPMGYGWGYRGWGPPYPSYIQRRRGRQAAAVGDASTFNHQSWGWGGDLMWGVLLVGLFWAASAYWWHWA
jgi:hypothetical protein